MRLMLMILLRTKLETSPYIQKQVLKYGTPEHFIIKFTWPTEFEMK